MLLTIVVFGVGIVNSFFTPERTRRILAGKKESVGNVLAVFRMPGARTCRSASRCAAENDFMIVTSNIYSFSDL